MLELQYGKLAPDNLAPIACEQVGYNPTTTKNTTTVRMFTYPPHYALKVLSVKLKKNTVFVFLKFSGYSRIFYKDILNKSEEIIARIVG